MIKHTELEDSFQHGVKNLVQTREESHERRLARQLERKILQFRAD